MRRHGWALCLGALLTGSAAAQPPAGEERFPPAPDLPGQVVSQPPADTPTATAADPKDARPAAPAAAPLPDAALAPYTSTATAAVAPCPAPAARAGCHIGYGDIKEWLLFRSNSRQSGHFVTPYRPPLQAWFPCEPQWGPVASRPTCAGCAAGAPAAGVVPPPTEGMPSGSTPAVPVSPDVPLGGGTPVGKCLEAEVLTTFQPVAPGIGFAPGAAPMANPTTQIKPTSFKPK